MACRVNIRLPQDVDGIYASIDTRIQKTPHVLLVHLEPLDKSRNTDIGTLKKERWSIFLELCTENFKETFIRYVNEVLFSIGKHRPRRHIFMRKNTHSTEK